MSATKSHDEATTNPSSRPQPVPRNGSYDWLRTANDLHSRTERRSIAQETTASAERGWYWHKDEQVPLPLADAAETATSIVSPSCGIWPAPPPKGRQGTEVKHVKGTSTVMSVAIQLADQNKKVAAVSAASAYHVGGGFSTGGRHALEEAVCAQSTLYRCLRHAWRQSGVPEGGAYIPADGVVLSPHVEVFREGTFKGYATLTKPRELTCVVSVAMPNLNSRVKDAHLETPANPEAYRSSLYARWRAVLCAALSAGASEVVCPDAGCGVYCNDPSVVGKTLGEVLRSEYWGLFKSIHLVGSTEFRSAVDAGVTSVAPRDGKLGKLKGKLLERMGGDKSEPASPVKRSSKAVPSFRKLLAAAGIPQTVREDTESSAAASDLGAPNDAIPEFHGAYSSGGMGSSISGSACTAEHTTPTKRSYSWRPWKRSNSATASTTASSGDREDLMSTLDAVARPVSLDGNSSSNGTSARRATSPNSVLQRQPSPLTEDLLKRHLETLLKNTAAASGLPEESEEIRAPRLACSYSGGIVPKLQLPVPAEEQPEILQSSRQYSAGLSGRGRADPEEPEADSEDESDDEFEEVCPVVIEAYGVNCSDYSTTPRVVMPGHVATSMRAGLAKLSQGNDMVIVSL